MNKLITALFLMLSMSLAFAGTTEHIRRKAIVTKVVTNRVIDAIQINSRSEICEYLKALKTSAEELQSLVENSNIENDRVSDASDYVLHSAITLKIACKQIRLDDLADRIEGIRFYLDVIKNETN